MTRFNAFSKVNGKYGAPMGRMGDKIANYNGGKLFARHCGGDGYYDRGGAYWGYPNVYAVYTSRTIACPFLTYVEATSEHEAIHIVQKESGILWNAVIYDNGGKTLDRYTAVFKDQPTDKPWVFEALGFNDQPYHSFGQHIECGLHRELGKRIGLHDLSDDAQKFVMENIS